MIPKIEFRYSWIYDQNYSRYLWVQKALKKQKRKYPSYKKIEKYIKSIEKIWKKHESKILIELPKITKLKWKDKKIICYVVGYCIPFSDPLTMPIYQKNKDKFIDVLIHELIHQLFTQEGNLKTAENSWKFIYDKYKKETKTTKIHIPLHAIHSKIYLRFFNKRRLLRDYEDKKRFEDYRKSWNIVNKKGYQNIINEFTRRIRE